MVPDPAPLGEQERATLLDLARRAIDHGVRTGERLRVDVTPYPASLQSHHGCFVTLHLDGKLRGCVGSLDARGPLADEVARSAHMAAFRDPRFAPLSAEEAPRLAIHVSVLTDPKPFEVRDEADLLARVRPGVDGLILRDGRHVGTFLPDVWKSLPEPRAFVTQLKLKAGLPADHWSDTVRVERYQTQSFE